MLIISEWFMIYLPLLYLSRQPFVDMGMDFYGFFRFMNSFLLIDFDWHRDIFTNF